MNRFTENMSFFTTKEMRIILQIMSQKEEKTVSSTIRELLKESIKNKEVMKNVESIF